MRRGGGRGDEGEGRGRGRGVVVRCSLSAEGERSKEEEYRLRFTPRLRVFADVAGYSGVRGTSQTQQHQLTIVSALLPGVCVWVVPPLGVHDATRGTLPTPHVH